MKASEATISIFFGVIEEKPFLYNSTWSIYGLEWKDLVYTEIGGGHNTGCAMHSKNERGQNICFPYQGDAGVAAPRRCFPSTRQVVDK